MDDETTDLVEGAFKLTDFFGSWPSFHDAAVDSVLIERVGPAVTITFRLNAPVVEQGQTKGSRRARIRMRWNEVDDLMLSGIDREENNWIGGLTIARAGDATHTALAKMDGIHGFIAARRIEVLDVEPIQKR